MVSSLAQASAERVTSARRISAFVSVDDLARRARLDARDLQPWLAPTRGSRLPATAAANSGGRQNKAARKNRCSPTRRSSMGIHEQPVLFEAPECKAIALDDASTGLTLRRAHRTPRLAQRSAQLKAPRT